MKNYKVVACTRIPIVYCCSEFWRFINGNGKGINYFFSSSINQSCISNCLFLTNSSKTTKYDVFIIISTNSHFLSLPYMRIFLISTHSALLALQNEPKLNLI